LAKNVSEKIKRQCPGVSWKDSFATLGRFDVVDIVEATDAKEVEKAAMVIRAYGHAFHGDTGCNALEGISRCSLAGHREHLPVLKSPDSASRGFFPFVLTPTPSWRRIRANHLS